MNLRPSRPSRFCGLAIALLLGSITASCGGSGGGGGGGAVGPAGLAAAARDTQVVLTWTAFPGAASYTVYKGTSSGLTTASPGPITGILVPTTTVTGLTNGTIYYFAVTATVGVETPLSAEAAATPVAPIFKIAESSPDVAAVNVPTNASVTFTFSSPVNVATAIASAATFQSGGLYPTSIPPLLNTPFTVSVDAAGTSLTIAHPSPLPASTAFRVTLANTVAGANGVPLAGPFVLKFTTAAAPALTPLTVTSVAPTNASANVPTTTAFEFTFARDVAPADVTSGNFTLTIASVGVPMIVSQPSSKVVRLQPTTALAAGQNYVATAGTGVKDTTGNALVAPVTTSDATAAAAAPAGTTSFMLYANSAGDPLEAELVKDLNKWEAAGGSTKDAKVRMYAQLDAANATHAPNVPATPFHVRLELDADRTKVTSPSLRVVPAGDQTTPAAVSTFIAACKADFAAQRNVFVFSDHGMNYQGANAANGNNRIDIAEMVTAFTTAQTAGTNFDVIVFDTCVMGGWEDLTIMAPFAKYILAGETTTTGMEWEEWFTDTFFPGQEKDDLTLFKDLVDKTVASANRGEPNDFFIYDCTKLPALKTAAVAFYAQLDAALTGGTINAAKFNEAAGKSLPMLIATGGSKELVDFVLLCQYVAAIPGVPGALITACTNVQTAVKDAVVYARTSVAWAKLSGVSCALGTNDEPATLAAVLQLASPGMVNPQTQLAAKRTTEFDTAAEQPTATATRSLNLVGPTPGVPAELDVGCTNEQGSLMVEYIEQLLTPTTFAFRGAIAWNNDPTPTTEWRWDGKLLRFSDGVNSTFVAGNPVDFDSTLLSVDAQLTDGATALVTDAQIIIDISVPRIESVFVHLPGTGSGLGRATLKAGDILRFREIRWDEILQDASETLVATPFTAGVAGIASYTLTRTAAPSGSYKFGVVTTDPGNNDDEVSVTVTVP